MEKDMRDEDATYGGKFTVDELRDIHRRIDNLERESNRQFTSVSEKLNQIVVEQAILKEKKPPFPMWAAGLLALGVSQIGVQIWLNADLSNTVKDIPKLEAKCESTAARMEVIRESVSSLSARVATIEEKVKDRIDNQFDVHNLNRYLDEKIDELEARLHGLEKKK